MKPATEIEHPEVRELAERTQDFVQSFAWCDRVTASSMAFAVAGVIGVFKVDLVPALPAADPTVWVVVGDLPPAYLAYEAGDTWQDALRGYVEEMGLWVQAVRDGKSVQELIPVNVPPTMIYAEQLNTRLEFIRTEFLDINPESLESDA
ncbi:MAG TPA: hypothetical protein VF864_13320 [Gemmatimonadales bacterium]